MSEETMKKESKTPFLSYMIYLICFIPYLMLLNASIFGVSFGFFGTSSMYYGWEAVNIQAVVLIAIPVLPAAALYQVIFLIVTRKRRSPLQKIISLALIVSIGGALFLSCAIYQKRTETHAENVYQQDKRIIETYLREAFGEEHAAEMEVQKPYEVSPYYQVKTPVLDRTFLVCLDESHTQVTSCYFCEAYSQNYDLPALLSQRLAKTCHVPGNMRLDIELESFPYEKAFAQDMEGLLDSCKFEVACVYFSADHYDREEILSEINRFYTGYGKAVLNYRYHDVLFFYVKVEDALYARVKVTPYPENPGICHLEISGYKDESGNYSVPFERLDYCLKP